MVLRVALIVQFIFKDAMTCVGLGWIHPFERLTFESSCISRIQPNALSNWCATHDSGSRILLLTLIFERLFGWGVYKRRMPVWVGLRNVWSHTVYYQGSFSKGWNSKCFPYDSCLEIHVYVCWIYSLSQGTHVGVFPVTVSYPDHSLRCAPYIYRTPHTILGTHSLSSLGGIKWRAIYIPQEEVISACWPQC